jgi:DNA-binding CsgD family transcriptional regulator/GAF domain-containing protein
MNAVSKIHEGSLSPVVESVYDCVADPARWVDSLRLICNVSEGCLAMLAVVDPIAKSGRMSISVGDPAILDALAEYQSEVPFYSALPHMEIDVPFTVDTIYALQGGDTRQTWLQSRIAREWVVPNGLDDFFWVPLMKQPARIGTLMVVTDRERRQISAEDLALVGALAPHVRRATVISDMFEAERTKTDIFRSVLENLGHAVVIVDREMRALFANSAAEMLLADGASATTTRGRLTFAYANANDAIAHAVAVGERNEFALGPSGINVPLARTHAPAVAHVLPLSRRDRDGRIERHAAAAIFIAAAGHVSMPALDAIAALFGLTAAEKRVAGHVAAGLTRRDIALAGGVSDGTVKSQLAAIFDKTETGDQRELQLLIRELSPPVGSR